MTQNAVIDPPPQEELKKMSFGDHLDELRRRLLWCTATLFVCVGVMLPMKTSVTQVFMQPYKVMWERAYLDWIEKLETEFAENPGPQTPTARLAAAEFLTKETIQAVLAGSYPEPEKLRVVAGYDKPYPDRSDRKAWDAFVADFGAYAENVRLQEDRIDQVIWHRARKDDILAGHYDDNADIIKTKGGFPLPKNLISTTPLMDFWTFMAATLLFACMFASPVLLWHIWGFVAAGLYKNERAVVHRALPLAIGLLVLGVTFGFFVMVPYAFYFLAKMMNWALVGPMFTVSDYFKFLLTLTVALGLVFQLPILMVALQKVGVLQRATMTKHWRGVVLGCFVISAMLTPPDPITQALMAVPMLALFLLGLFLMWRVEQREKRREGAVRPA